MRLILLLFLFFNIFQFSHANEKRKRDSLDYIWLNSQVSDTSILRTVKYTVTENLKSNPDTSSAFTHNWHFADDISRKKYSAMSLLYSGFWLCTREEYLAGLKCYQESMEISKEIHDEKAVASIKILIGNLFLHEINYKAAVQNCLFGNTIFINSGDYYIQRNSCECLYYSNKAKGNLKSALEFLEKKEEVVKMIHSAEVDRKLKQLKSDITDSLNKKEKADLEIRIETEKQNASRRLGNNFGWAGAFLGVVFVAISFYYNEQKRKKLNEQLALEKKKSDELLLNILPSETAEELKQFGSAKAKKFESVTVMFTDFKNFTQASEKMSPEELVAEINYCYSEFDRIISKYGIEKIKTIGDSYMCAGGLPKPSNTHVEDVIHASLDLLSFMIEHRKEREKKQNPFFEIRIGIHTGPVVAGIVGIKKFAYDIWGDTVNIASRIESSGEAGKINISGTTFGYVNGKFKCTYRGKIQAKNMGEIEMYFVEGIEITKKS